MLRAKEVKSDFSICHDIVHCVLRAMQHTFNDDRGVLGCLSRLLPRSSKLFLVGAVAHAAVSAEIDRLYHNREFDVFQFLITKLIRKTIICGYRRADLLTDILKVAFISGHIPRLVAFAINREA